jgi:hypothetical protein
MLAATLALTLAWRHAIPFGMPRWHATLHAISMLHDSVTCNWHAAFQHDVPPGTPGMLHVITAVIGENGIEHDTPLKKGGAPLACSTPPSIPLFSKWYDIGVLHATVVCRWHVIIMPAACRGPRWHATFQWWHAIDMLHVVTRRRSRDFFETF